MSNVVIPFKILEDDEYPPPGYNKSSVRLNFDVKIDFTSKSQLVKDGHRTTYPESSSYAGVVSREKYLDTPHTFCNAWHPCHYYGCA